MVRLRLATERSLNAQYCCATVFPFCSSLHDELGGAATINPDPATIHSPIVPLIAPRIAQLAPDLDTMTSPTDRAMLISKAFRLTGDGPAPSPRRRPDILARMTQH